MPRIVPLQLLKCLKVLLDDNGGILSIGEVKRIAGLMNRYSKKLVSKCIYVQILKVTKTELLGEFMGVGGWSLVYNWLNDAIRAMNWPLVQEILELLLLCPVDVDRLKINSAPKLVKGLCRDGGNEGVRILAKRLVEQWLKVVTENTSSAQVENVTQQPQTLVTATPPINITVPPTSHSTPIMRQESKVLATAGPNFKVKPTPPMIRHPTARATVEEDPLADVADTPPEPSTYAPTPAQKKASETGLVFKLVYKDGQQVLAKVPPKSVQETKEDNEEEEKAESIEESVVDSTDVEVENQGYVDEHTGADPNTDAEPETEADADREAETEAEAEREAEIDTDEREAEEEPDSAVSNAVEEEEDTRTSQDKAEKESESSADEDAQITSDKNKAETVEQTISNRKRSVDADSDKSAKEERRSSKDSKESKSKNKSKDKEREKDKDKEHKLEKDKDKDRKSSSSSSSHKSSGHKSKNSSSSKSKMPSTSSTSHRSSSDKYRSDKDRTGSSSSKDKERKEGSSSSSKHRSSSTSSSKSSKDKHRDKDKDKSFSSTASSSSTKKEKEKGKDREKDKEKEKEKEKERDRETQAEKDKETIAKLVPPSIDKLGRIPKKPKDETESTDTTKPTSITIPSKKASMSIEIRRDSEKAKTVKTYKSQFRSHGLTEEAPPPPSRKGLKKPTSTTSAPGTVIPTSLPSSLKRPSPPPTSADSPTLKKSKIDINNLTVANEKPGAIKLIAPKKIQTLVETNIFSDALSAATGPKKITKRKRSTTQTQGQTKEGEGGTPTSPDAQKVTPLKFYQDTLDEQAKGNDKSDKENDAKEHNNKSEDSDGADKGNSTEDDDDIPLKKVKEDIEQKVLREQKAADESANNIESGAATETGTGIATGTSETTANVGGSVDITTSSDAEEDAATKDTNVNPIKAPEDDDVRKPPGPGCGPNGPPGVLMLHRRKGPKKKLTWRSQEHLEQIRYFELDENERVNVTKPQSFMDMKNLERFSERDAINIARRGFTHEDNMRPQTEWRQTLIEVDGVPPHPNGNQSKQRKVQAEREQTTLRALYFSHSMIPDSPAEAELEPHFSYDIPVIPLEDITGNPDAVSDYTNMPWPEPKGSPKFTEANISNTIAPASKLTNVQVNALTPNNVNAYPGFMPQYPGTPTNNMLSAQMQMPRPVPAVGAAAAAIGGGQLPPAWQGGNFNGVMPMGAMSVNAVAQQNLLGPFGPPAGNAAPWQMHAGGAQYGPAPGAFNNAPNFGPMGMMAPRVMTNMAPANAFERNTMSNSNHHNSNNSSNNNNNQSRNNNGGNWRTGSSFQDNNSSGGGGGNWRSGGGGHSRSGGGGGGRDSNNGVCKAFMRGHCRLGKSCKYIHPKSKRI